MYNSKLKIMDNELTFLSYNQGVNCEFRVDDILDSPLWVTDDSNGLIKAIPLLNADRIVSSNPNDIILDENKCVILENNEDTLISLITDDVGSVHFYTVELYSFAPYTQLGLVSELTVYCLVSDEYLNTLNNVSVSVVVDDEVVSTVDTDNNGLARFKVGDACSVKFVYGEVESEEITITDGE